MKIKHGLVVSGILLFVTLELSGQDTLDYKVVFPSEISAGYGLGTHSVKDEYISREQYSGKMPYFNLEWVRFHYKNAYRLEIEYGFSNSISNNNISAEAVQFTFNQDFIYPIGKFSLLSRNVYVYMGPSVQFFYYDVYYNFASPGTFISPKTFGIIGSLGINTEFIYAIHNKLRVEGILRSNLLSFAGKKNDERKFNNESNPTLISVFTTTKFDCDLNIRYYFAHRVSAAFGYKFDLLRIDKWDPYIATSNSLIISINYKF